MMFDHIPLCMGDLARSKRFYDAVFGDRSVSP
jgi:hypothetical protein